MRNEVSSEVSEEANESRKNDPVRGIVDEYGDLIFDLCVSVLDDPVQAQFAFRTLLKQARKEHKGNGYSRYRRAWILKITNRHLQALIRRQGGKAISPREETDLAEAASEVRLNHIEHYLHRLSLEDRMMILLRDKYGLPYDEIAMAMDLPEPSLKVRREQVLRTLEGWIWETA